MPAKKSWDADEAVGQDLEEESTHLSGDPRGDSCEQGGDGQALLQHSWPVHPGEDGEGGGNSIKHADNDHGDGGGGGAEITWTEGEVDKAETHPSRCCRPEGIKNNDVFKVLMKYGFFGTHALPSPFYFAQISFYIYICIWIKPPLNDCWW